MARRLAKCICVRYNVFSVHDRCYTGMLYYGICRHPFLVSLDVLCFRYCVVFLGGTAFRVGVGLYVTQIGVS